MATTTTVGDISFLIQDDADYSISGNSITINSGVISATIKDTDSPVVYFNADNGSFQFTCAEDNESIAVNNDLFASGNATYYADSIYISDNSVAFISDSVVVLAEAGSYTVNNKNITTADENINITVQNSKFEFTTNDTNMTVGYATLNGTFTVDSDYIYGSDGNDTIINGKPYMTISAGDGDDFISIDSSANTIVYTGGNDSISNLGSDDKIVISEEFATVISGNNLIFKVNGGSITAINSVGLSVNVSGTAASEFDLDSSETFYLNGIAYTAVDNAHIYIDNNSVTVSGGVVYAKVKDTYSHAVYFDASGGDVTVTCAEDNSSLVVNNDVFANGTATYYAESIYLNNNAVANISDSVVVLANAGSYTLNNKNITTADENINVSVHSTLDFTTNDKNMTVGGATLNGTFTVDNNYIYGSEGNDTILNNDAEVTINAGNGDDFIRINADSNTIIYTGGNDYIQGVDDNDSIHIAEYSSVSAGSGVIFSVGDYYSTVVGTDFNVVGSSSTNTLAASLADSFLKRTDDGYPAFAQYVVDLNATVPETPNYDSETWDITSSDNLKLTATHFTPTNSNGKWALIVHGYGRDQRYTWDLADSYLAAGYNVLTPDMRAAGNSEGVYTTMGILESQDIVLWLNEIAAYDSSALVALHGISSGAAAAILAANNSDVSNLAVLIAQSAYTNAYDAFYNNLQDALDINPDPIMKFTDIAAQNVTGYKLSDAAPIDAVTSIKVASIFISGSDDDLGSVTMMNNLYNTSTSSVKRNLTSTLFSDINDIIEDVTPANILFDGKTIKFTNSDGDDISESVETATYASMTGTTLTLTKTGKILKILISGNGSVVNVDDSTLRTSSSNVTTLKADDYAFNINGSDYYFTDDAVNFVVDSNNLLSAITNLNGTVSGNFSKGATNINGSDRVYILGDSDVSIAADTTNRINTISGISADTTILAAGTNSTLVADEAGSFNFDSINYYSENIPTFMVNSRGYVTTLVADTSTVIGSDSNDTLFISGNNISIDAGKGNDIITLTSANSVNYDYYDGDGNDTIIGLNSTDSINVLTGTYSTVVSGDDVVISIGDNSIRARNAANTNFIITGLEVGEHILNASQSMVIGDILYTATEDATLTANADKTITINNGIVTATFNGLFNPAVTFDASNGEFSFYCAKVDDLLAVTRDNFTLHYESGNVTYYADSIYSPQGTLNISDSAKIINAAVNSAGTNANFDGTLFTFTNDGTTTAYVDFSDTAVSNLAFKGSLTYNTATTNLNFTNGSALVYSVDNKNITVTAEDNIGGTFAFDSNTFYFSADNAPLTYAVDNRSYAVTANGSFALALDGNVTLNAGANFNLAWDNYNLNINAAKDSAGTIKLADSNLILSPNFDNLNITLANSNVTVNNISATSSLTVNDAVIIPANSNLNAVIGDYDFNIAAGNNAVTVNLDDDISFTAADDAFNATFAGFTNSYIGTLLITNADVPAVAVGTVISDTSAGQAFILADAGNFTVDNFTITTTATNTSVAVSDNAVSFNPNSNVITVNNRLFSGDGAVTVHSDGAFNLDNGAAVVMAAADSLNIGDIPVAISRNVAGYVTVAGVDGGFNFTHSVSGGLLTHNLIVNGDSDYSVDFVASGIGTLSGISNGASIVANASLNGVNTLTNFNVLTDDSGIFSFNDNSYTIAGDNSALFNVNFNSNQATLRTLTDFDGTVSGNFNSPVTINGSEEVHILGDTFIDVVANSTNAITNVNNISDGATIVSAGKNSTLTANAAGNFTFGNSVNSALTYTTRESSATFFTDANGNITFAGDNATINGTSNANTISNNGNRTLINALAGNDSINNSGSFVTILGGAGIDTITNSGTNASISGGDGNDFISDSADSVRIDGDAGNDRISVSGNFVTVFGGADNDSVWISGSRESINGGAGNDTITARVNNSTINGGAGNDYVSINGSGNIILHEGNSGNETIAGLSDNDTIKIVSGNFTSVISGTDVFINVGEDRITAVGMANKTLNVDGLAVGEFTLAAGDTKIVDNITFTATKDATLNANEDGTFEISSGTVTVVLTGRNDPEIIFDASDGEFEFACEQSGTALTVTVNDLPLTYTTGKITYYADKITPVRGALGMLDESGDMTVSINVINAAGTNITTSGNTYKLVSDGRTTAAITYNNSTISNVTFNGTATYNTDSDTFTVNSNASLRAAVEGRTVNFITTGAAGGNLTFDDSEKSITYKPNSNDGNLIMSVTKNGTTRQTTLSCTGTVTYNLDGTITLSTGTTLTNTWSDGYSFLLTTNKEASGTIKLTSSGLDITPADSDSLVGQLTLPSGFVISNIKLDGEVIYNSGVLTLKAGSTLSGTKSGTAVSYSAVDGDITINFGTDYLTLTVASGGKIVETLNNITTTYSNAPIKVSSETTLSPSIVIETDGTGQSYVLESSGTYTINDKAYILNDDNGATLTYNGTGIAVSDLDGDVSLSGSGTVTVSSGNNVAALDVDAALDIAVKNATISSDGKFSVDTLNNFDIYTLESAREGNYTLGTITAAVSGDRDYDFLFDNAGNVTLTNISNGADVSVDGSVKVVNDEAGTYYLNGNKLEAAESAAVTLNSDKSISFNPDEVTYNGMKFSDVDAVTMQADGEISLDNNAKVALSSGEYTINNISFEIDEAATVSALTNGFAIGNETLRVSGDSDYSVKVNDGVTVSGISAGATVKGTGEYKILTDNSGAFTFGSNSYTITDDEVVIDANFNSETATLKTVDELDGTISGNFTNAATVNGVNIWIAGDEAINVAGNNDSVTLISGVSGGASVNAAGYNTTLMTDGAGGVKLGNYSLNASGATTLVNDSAGEYHNYTISSATIVGTTGNDVINVNGDNVNVQGNGGNDTITITGGNETVSVGAGVVKLDGSALIQTPAIEVTVSSGEYTFTAGSPVELEGVKDGAVVNATGSGSLYVIATGAGSYTFGGENIVVSGDNYVEMTIAYSSGAGRLSEISNFTGSLEFTAASSQRINGSTMTISPSGQRVTLTTDSSGQIQTLDGLSVGTTLTLGERGRYTINGNEIRLTDAANQSITITSDGITVTYPTTATEAAWLTESTSEYMSTVEGYSDSDNHDGNLVYEISGDVNAYFAESTGKKKVLMSDGVQTVTFNGDGGNVASVEAESSGDKTILLGNGGDIAIIEGTESQVSVKAGTGADKIASHGYNVHVDVSAGGATKVMASGGNVTLDNYDHSSGAGVQGISASNDFTIGDGYIEMLGARITFNDANNSNAAVFNYYNSSGVMTKTGFTYENGGTVDLSSERTGARLVSTNGNAVLLGGSGNDTVESTGDDYINAGGGNNYITLSHKNYSEGATIAITSGRNTIEGLYEMTDKLLLNDIANAEYSYSGGEAIIRDGTAYTLIENTRSADADIDFMNLNLVNEVGDSLRAALTGTNGAIDVDVAYIPNAYIGTRASVNFGDLSGDLNINLLNGSGVYDGNNIYFRGVNKLTASNGNSTVIGAASNNTIGAGRGNTSMMGGIGNDLLIGNTDSSKTGTTTYFFTANCGKDTITNFSAGDKITTFDVEVTGVRTLGNDVFVDFDANSVRIVNTLNEDIRFNDVVAQIGDTKLTYDNEATYYNAMGNNATIGVSATVDNANVWLQDGGKYEGNIRVIDASNATGNATLAGNANDNVIVSGSGNNSLWGGGGSSDTLTGGDGTDMFWYMRGDGNDVITRAETNDIINLSGWTLADINTAEITSSGVNITFSDGGSLEVRGANINADFLLEGVRYKADQNSRVWNTSN